ncbi:MAG TPA: hypothetical protein VGM14_29805 [Streptosporangiaceae bacterium]
MLDITLDRPPLAAEGRLASGNALTASSQNPRHDFILQEAYEWYPRELIDQIIKFDIHYPCGVRKICEGQLLGFSGEFSNG